MLEVWIILFGVIAASETLLMSGMTATLKTYADHFPWLISELSSTQDNKKLTASPSFDHNTEKPTTLKEYLQGLPSDHENQEDNSSGNWANTEVVVVARIGDYDNDTEGEWTIITKPNKFNESSNSNEQLNSKANPEVINDYHALNDNAQKYFNEYQDLLYTFKDFVKIGAHPSVQRNISKNDAWYEDEKYFNVTYIMPIPKTKKYFEIKITNLSKTQYNEINDLLQEHLNKSNSKEMSKSNEQEIMLIDESVKGNSLKSYAHSDLLKTQNKKSNDTSQSSRLDKFLPSSGQPIKDYFQPSLTPEVLNYLLNNFDSIYLGLNNKSVDSEIFQPTKSPPNVMKNNGFHAEIATDYVTKHDGNDESNTQPDFLRTTSDLSKGLQGLLRNNNIQGGSSKNVSSQLRRNRTKLFPQLRSKRPIMNAPYNILDRKINRIEQPITISSTQPPAAEEPQINNNKTSSNYSQDILLNGPRTTLPLKNIKMNEDIKFTDEANNTNTSFQGWTDIYKWFNNSLQELNPPAFPSSPSFNSTNEIPVNSPDQILKSMNVMEVAELLIVMKKKIDEEDKKKAERYKNYIKQYLGSDEGSVLIGKDNNGNIMKINKQENILEELKLLMIDYFATMNFITQDKNDNGSSLAIQSILEAKNIFELMEQSSQLVKSKVHLKMHAEAKEPTRFVKQIVEKQVEKCKKIFNKDSISQKKQTPLGSKKNNSHRRFQGFTKCMNFRLIRCIKGFSQWLEKGKFYLRPQFQLERAYEHYETERNVYCLRNYSPTALGSNPHGTRVLPPKVSRKSGSRKLKARPGNLRFRLRKLKNGQHGEKPVKAKPIIERNRRYKKQRTSAQRPIVQRYSDQQGEVSIVRQNGRREYKVQ